MGKRLKENEIRLLQENNERYNFFYSRIKLLAKTCFEWENLPNLIPERFIEKTLYSHGKIAFYNDEKLGFIVAKCNPIGQLNFYDEALRYSLDGINYHQEVDADEVVIIRNTDDETPSYIFTDYYANKLYKITSAQNTNIMLQKFPVIVLCEESQRMTLENLMMDYDENKPFIFGNKQLDLNGIKSIDLKVPFIANELQQHLTDVWNECLMFFGINNANTHKRERLITDEVNSNNQLIQLESDKFLKERLKAVKQINEKFGLNIIVKRRESIYPQDEGEEGEE